MPTYGYHCDNCGNEFDIWQKMTDEAGADCPVCGKPARRLFYPAGIVFKGSGFYKTDSRSSAPSTSTSSSSKDSETKTSDSEKPANPEAKSDSTKTDSGSKAADSGKSGSTKPKD